MIILKLLFEAIPEGQETLPWQPTFVGRIHRITEHMYFGSFIHRTDSLDAGGW